MDNTVWIVVGVVVALVLIAIVLTARKQRTAHRRAQAEEIRTQLVKDDAQVRHRESIAAETAARARAAQAEADAKAAEAQRLQNAAESHQHEVSASREELDKRREHAERLDPSAATGRPGHQTPG
jgi:FtsZ-interacting cell division protein ZipA